MISIRKTKETRKNPKKPERNQIKRRRREPPLLFS
jgi:hypothetical protein